MLGDLMAIESLSGRFQWLVETAFPPAQYMRQKYADEPNAWLPLLYARRGAQGLRRLATSLRTDRAN